MADGVVTAKRLAAPSLRPRRRLRRGPAVALSSLLLSSMAIAPSRYPLNGCVEIHHNKEAGEGKSDEGVGDTKVETAEPDAVVSGRAFEEVQAWLPC